MGLPPLEACDQGIPQKSHNFEGFIRNSGAHRVVNPKIGRRNPSNWHPPTCGPEPEGWHSWRLSNFGGDS